MKLTCDYEPLSLTVLVNSSALLCCASLDEVSLSAPAYSLSFASVSIFLFIATTLIGLVLITLAYLSFSCLWSGFFHFSSQLAFDLVKWLCLTCGNKPPDTFIL